MKKLKFETVWKEQNYYIKAIIYNHIKDENAVAEIMSSVALKLFLHLHTFRSDSKLTTWLFRLVMNEVLMHLRLKRNDAQRLYFIEQKTKQLESKHEPYSQYEAKDQLIKLIKCSKDILNNDDWLHSCLLHKMGFQFKELSKIKKCSSSAIKSRIHRAKLTLLNVANRF